MSIDPQEPPADPSSQRPEVPPGIFASRKPTARGRMAARLYASGAAKTKEQASLMAGLSPSYLGVMSSPKHGSEEVKRIISEVDAQLADATIATSTILASLGRQAIGKIARLMDHDNPNVALKAAIDLADRSPETHRTQHVQMQTVTISGRDAAELAKAITESARLRETYADVETAGLVEVSDLQRQEEPARPPGLNGPS